MCSYLVLVHFHCWTLKSNSTSISKFTLFRYNTNMYQCIYMVAYDHLLIAELSMNIITTTYVNKTTKLWNTMTSGLPKAYFLDSNMTKIAMPTKKYITESNRTYNSIALCIYQEWTFKIYPRIFTTIKLIPCTNRKFPHSIPSYSLSTVNIIMLWITVVMQLVMYTDIYVYDSELQRSEF